MFQSSKPGRFNWNCMHNIDFRFTDCSNLQHRCIQHFVLVPIITHVQIYCCIMSENATESLNDHHPELEIVFLCLLMVKNYTSTVETVSGVINQMKVERESFPLFIVVIGGINFKVFAFILHRSFFIDIQRLILAFRTEEHNIVQFISFIPIPNPFIITKGKCFAIGVGVDKNEQFCMEKSISFYLRWLSNCVIWIKNYDTINLFVCSRAKNLIKHVADINCGVMWRNKENPGKLHCSRGNVGKFTRIWTLFL